MYEWAVLCKCVTHGCGHSAKGAGPTLTYLMYLGWALHGDDMTDGNEHANEQRHVGRAARSRAP